MSIDYETIINFCSITNNTERYIAFQNPAFKETKTINFLEELINTADSEDERARFIEHKEIILEYQRKGESVLSCFFPSQQIETSFMEFVYGFNNFEARKQFLINNPFLLDRISLTKINKFIETYTKERKSETEKMRLYRNLLKACNYLGIDQAFKEFDTPDEETVNLVNRLFRADSIIGLLQAGSAEILKRDSVRNVFHYLQAKFESNQDKRKSIVALWDYVSAFQEGKRFIWFWE